ncbi:Tyrosine decarboxylase [Bulinus truncatus]|nr:Tyrosine decarboxylase [Bulinus truncatus]
MEDCQILSKLVGYCSKLAHSCVEKAGMIGFVKMRHLDVDENYSLRGHVLEDAIEEDKKLGLIPFFVCATLGTTACCSFDNLSELGEVASRQGVYLHVDAAYAGNALICQEFHYLKNGVENVDSFSFNTNKWLQVNFDCSLMWVKNVDMLTTALTVDPLYLQHKHGDKAIDLRHWGIPLSRRFRALKLWFVIRIYGVEGLQKRIREHCRLAKLFASKVLSDERFEILGEITMGLVCFRLHGPNTLTQRLLKMINDSGKLHMVPAMLNEHYIIRFALCTEYACEEDISFAWKVITTAATELLQARHGCDSNRGNGYRNSHVVDEDTFAAFEEEIIFDNQREHLQRAQIMRSLFFKMVSDPKCYNPRVLKSLGRQLSSTRSFHSDGRDCPVLPGSQSLKDCGNNKSTQHANDNLDLDINTSDQFDRNNLSQKEHSRNSAVYMDLRVSSENIESKTCVKDQEFDNCHENTKIMCVVDTMSCDGSPLKLIEDRTKMKYLTTNETLCIKDMKKKNYIKKGTEDKEVDEKDKDESIYET